MQWTALLTSITIKLSVYSDFNFDPSEQSTVLLYESTSDSVSKLRISSQVFVLYFLAVNVTYPDWKAY